jgi:hypothetical protein
MILRQEKYFVDMTTSFESEFLILEMKRPHTSITPPALLVSIELSPFKTNPSFYFDLLYEPAPQKRGTAYLMLNSGTAKPPPRTCFGSAPSWGTDLCISWRKNWRF